MVCSPHRYIVAGVAQGIGYESGISQTRTYAPMTYNASPIRQYEQQTTTNNTYNNQTKNEQQETTTQKNNWYAYRSDAQKTTDLFSAAPETDARIPDTYVPLRPRQSIFAEEPAKEAPMTNQNIRQTKQKLAQLIMNELDALGPREEHTHEHGEHTHVH